MNDVLGKLVAERRLRGLDIPAEQVAEAEALLDDLRAAASRHPCAQTASAQDFLLPRVALDIATGSAKRASKQARRAANRDAHRQLSEEVNR